MKKILLLTMLMLGALACSVEEETVQTAQQADVFYAKANTDNEQAFAAATLPNCFTKFSADVYVDVSGGFGNPVVVFVPVITGNVAINAKFWVRVEVQPLSDCDDLNSNTGALLTFGPSVPVQNVNSSPPSVSVAPGSMPLCYKWRFVFEGVGSGGKITCTNASRWQELPLF